MKYHHFMENGLGAKIEPCIILKIFLVFGDLSIRVFGFESFSAQPKPNPPAKTDWLELGNAIPPPTQRLKRACILAISHPDILHDNSLDIKRTRFGVKNQKFKALACGNLSQPTKPNQLLMK